MKKIILIVAGLFILTSCATSSTIAYETAPLCHHSDCTLLSVHSHAW